ncbi:hypothetical protein ACIP2X_38025 [Streptomyces sp. NPDC089424]|uniref:hypothetical protein n=1 Tax=Streptomyces sp. NPDC089424 TaxID=3365917 RepID=UPI0037FF6897
MTETARYYGQIPTDPATLLVLAIAVICAASRLTPDQAQALDAVGGIAELALLLYCLAQGRR